MGKVLVLFDSHTGNTEKMATLVASGASRVKGIEVRTSTIANAGPRDIEWCDGLAVGTPTNMGVMSWQMKRFWDEEAREVWGKVDGKIATVFSSSGAWGGGAEIACLATMVTLINFGFLVFGVTDYVGKKFSLHYGAINAKSPRKDEEKMSCERLGERLAQWVAVFVDGRQDLWPQPLDENNCRPGILTSL